MKRVLDVGSERKGTSERRLTRTGSCEKGSEVWAGLGDAEAGDARGDFWKRSVVCTYAWLEYTIRKQERRLAISDGFGVDGRSRR